MRFIWFVDHFEYPVYFIKELTERQAFLISFFSVLNLVFIFFQGPVLLMLYKLWFLGYFSLPYFVHATIITTLTHSLCIT